MESNNSTRCVYLGVNKAKMGIAWQIINNITSVCQKQSKMHNSDKKCGVWKKPPPPSPQRKKTHTHHYAHYLLCHPIMGFLQSYQSFYFNAGFTAATTYDFIQWVICCWTISYMVVTSSSCDCYIQQFCLYVFESHSFLLHFYFYFSWTCTGRRKLNLFWKSTTGKNLQFGFTRMKSSKPNSRIYTITTSL